jgi:hypothetical protein
MRKSTLALILALSGVLVAAFGAAAIATVTAPGLIKISGVDVPATAASSVPVGFGDSVSTTNSEAIIRFDTRGTVNLHRGSSVKITQSGENTMVCLTKGSYNYKFEPDSKLIICKDDKPLATLLQGEVSMGSSKRIPAIIAASGGGAALIAGVAKQKSKDCPDPDGAGQSHGDGHDCGVIK